jgi:hypothetical protein
VPDVPTRGSSHQTPQLIKIVNELKPTNVIRPGGAGYKVLLVLDGVADAYVYGAAAARPAPAHRRSARAGTLNPARSGGTRVLPRPSSSRLVRDGHARALQSGYADFPSRAQVVGSPTRLAGRLSTT